MWILAGDLFPLTDFSIVDFSLLYIERWGAFCVFGSGEDTCGPEGRWGSALTGGAGLSGCGRRIACERATECVNEFGLLNYCVDSFAATGFQCRLLPCKPPVVLGIISLRHLQSRTASKTCVCNFGQTPAVCTSCQSSN